MFDIANFQSKRKGSFGKELYYFYELNSTNIMAEQLARDGCSEGTVVLADCQTEGKGRKGSLWYSPPGVNLYFTTVLRPDIRQLQNLPFLVALAVSAMLSRLGIHADLKWPNDVLAGGRKICGILVQTSIEQNHLEYAAAGCGVNVNWMEFPEEIRETATSIAAETGSNYSRESVLASALFEMESLYERMNGMPWEEFAGIVEENSTYVRGCEVSVRLDDRILEGITAGLDSRGGLKIHTNAGCETVYSGEVQTCRKK